MGGGTWRLGGWVRDPGGSRSKAARCGSGICFLAGGTASCACSQAAAHQHVQDSSARPSSCPTLCPPTPPHPTGTSIPTQVYPDVGVSAMLKNQWTDAAFSFASLNDRKPVQPEDDIVVLAAPDPQVWGGG